VFRESPRVRYRSIPLLAYEADDPTPHLGLVGMYRRILDERGEHLVDVVRAVIDPEGSPVAIGCAAGKDRTGVAVAIILTAVGVSDLSGLRPVCRSSRRPHPNSHWPRVLSRRSRRVHGGFLRPSRSACGALSLLRAAHDPLGDDRSSRYRAVMTGSCSLSTRIGCWRVIEGVRVVDPFAALTGR